MLNKFSFYLLRVYLLCFVFLEASTFLNAAVTHEAPKIEGLLAGDLYQLEADSVKLKKDARIEGTWYVPGTPKLVLKGGTLQSGSIVEGDGSPKPSNYEIKLEDDSFVERIVNRTRLSDLPEVGPVMPASGIRKVDIEKPTDTIGNPSTIKDLRLHLQEGKKKDKGSDNQGIQIYLPAGAYGKLSVHDDSTLVLGTAGAVEPEVYSFDELDVKESGQIEVVAQLFV